MKTAMMIAIIVLPALRHCHAQESEKADTLINEMEEITVSANRWEQNLNEVPFRISRITPALVKLHNPQTAADLLALSENVFIQKSQLGGGSPVIRGFATSRVLIVVDGIRMNNAIFRSGNVQNVISLDPNAVAQAEVVFGPGAVMYGSDAIGGVMDFHTLPPEFAKKDGKHFTGAAMTRFSSANNEMTAHVDLRGGIGRWALVTSITRSRFDDLRMGSRGPEEYTRPDYVVRQGGTDIAVANADARLQVSTGYAQWNAMQKVSFRFSASSKLTYGFHFSATSDYSRYDRLLVREGGVPSYAEWYYGPQKWILHSLRFESKSPAALFDAVKFVAGYQDFKESRHTRRFNSGNRTNRTEKVHALSANIDFDKKLNDRVSFFYGGELVANRVHSIASRQDIVTGHPGAAPTRYPDGSDWRSAGAYMNVKMIPAQKWILNVSARYTFIYTGAAFDSVFFDFPFTHATLRNSALSGSLGVVWHPASAVKLYANLSTGFRAPNVDDIGKVFDSEPRNVVVPNPALRPENAYGAEAGLVLFPGPAVKIDVAGYYTFLDNAIARSPSVFNGMDSIDYDGVYSRVLAQKNISKIQVAGLQAGIDWEASDRVRLTSDINYQKGTEHDPQAGARFSPAHVAPLFGSTHIIYRNHPVTVDLYSTYNGKVTADELAPSERADHHLYAKDADGDPWSPSWWTLNLKGRISILEHISFSAGVENIFDKRYRPYASGISAPGRNFIFSIAGNL